MPVRDWKLRIEDILEAIDDIGRFTEGMNYESFCSDTKTVKAVLYNVAVIGEAARLIPTEVQLKHPEIPWREMSDIRNVVIHEYFGVDLDILWDTISDDLFPLVPLLKGILQKESESVP
jgi:uncharacterized protein with HEPN domain